MPLRTVVVLLTLLSTPSGLEQAASTEKANAKTWVGRHQEIEEYLKTAECVSMKEFAPNYAARCTFRPGGPIAQMAWRPDRPGVHRGFRESYRTEIAAYELDKLLKMGMVPPSVQREVQGITGAAQQWVENIVDAKGPGPTDAQSRAHWDAQVARMGMFDNLIDNRGRSRGTMLRDGAWNLILIDHSRSFGVGNALVHKMTRVDDELWERIDALTRSQLDTALGAWLEAAEIAAILDRREVMRTEIRLLRR